MVRDVRERRRAVLKSGLAVAGAGLGALAGCAVRDGERTPRPTTRAPPRLTVAPDRGIASPIFERIVGEGLDEEYGFELDINWTSPSGSAEAVATGQIDAGYVSVLGAARLNARGTAIRLLWPVCTNTESLVVDERVDVRTDSLSGTLSSLQGLTVGVLPESDAHDDLFSLLLAEHGLDRERYDIRTGPPPVLAGLTQKDEIAGMVNVEPESSKLVASGEFERVLAITDAWRTLYDAPLSAVELAALTDRVEEKRAAFEGFFEAFYEASAVGASDPRGLLGTSRGELSLDEHELSVTADFAEQIGLFRSSFPEPLRAGDRKLAQLGYENGLLDDDPNPETIFVDPREW